MSTRSGPWTAKSELGRFDASAGSRLVTVVAPDDEWDEFFPDAEEILVGISSPDL